jgi:C2H2 type zinc finger protein
MAASTRALTPTHTGPFGSVLENPPSVKSLQPLSNTTIRRSPSPRSPRLMASRISPPPSTSTRPESDPKQLPAATGAPPPDVTSLAKDATAKISSPLAAIVKSVSIHDNASVPNAQTSPTSVSSLTSLDAKPATTTTAPAVPMDEDSMSGRPVVDPGLPGASDATPNRAFTFPPPLSDDQHTPAGRNLSLPTNVFNSGSPKSGGSASKRHKCPYCSTEFTRHHNLKSHLLTHSQEKPYECQQCNSRFRRLHDLKRHTKLHTGERPHECNRCGRRFARGDALARHAKGPGGCAGRRPSFIEEDPSGSRVDDSMEGVEYTAEPEHMDDSEEMNGHRRSSLEPNKRSRTDSYRPATYPGVVPPGGIPPIYPSAPPRSRDHSISSQQGGPLAPIQHFNAGGQPVFQQGMTESPKPISPGQSGEHRSNLATSRQLPGTSPILPPPGSSAHLPSLPSFAAPHPPGSSHASNSLSSGGSGSLSRENNTDVWDLVRQLQANLAQTRTEHESMIAKLKNDYAAVDTENRKEISSLREELDRLKGLLNEGSGSSSSHPGKSL